MTIFAVARPANAVRDRDPNVDRAAKRAERRLELIEAQGVIQADPQAL